MNILTPNSRGPAWLVGAWVGVAIILWTMLKPQVFPTPLEVLATFPTLWADGLGAEIVSSFVVNVEALILSALVGLPLAYLSRVPAVTPVATFIAKLRFVGAGVFFLPLLFLFDGHGVKVGLLFLGELFYLVTTMQGVVLNIPQYRFDDAYTLKMGEWWSVWYVVIRGTVAEAVDALRDNAAIGWSMVMFVEGVVRSEGGVGVMLLNMQKHADFSQVYAIIIAIILVGITQDWFIGQVRKVVAPYA